MKLKLAPKPGILKITPYIGGDINPPGVTRLVGLSSNENALGPSPKAISAIQENLPSIHLYPSGGAHKLRKVIAKHHHLDPDRIVCSNGSEELIQLLIQGYAGVNDEVLFSQYAFFTFKIFTNCVGATAVETPAPNLSIDIDQIIANITPHTRVVLIDNPSNPIGSLVKSNDIRRLHAALPSNVLLVLDSAYAEYVADPDYTAGQDLVEEFDNVVMTRTFSKFYGLAGIRIGWCYAPPNVVDVLHRIRPPFSTNSLAQIAAEAALSDKEYITAVRNHYLEVLPWFMEQLDGIGLNYIPSVTNFVLVKFLDSPKVYTYLASKGIIVRPVGNYGLDEWLRISLGRKKDMEQVILALQEFFK